MWKAVKQSPLGSSRLRSLLSKLLPPTPQPRTGAVEKPSRIIEESDYYHVGGYHRVSLGDTFDSGKYTVLRKLGFGEFSTVWLAKNSQSVESPST